MNKQTFSDFELDYMNELTDEELDKIADFPMPDKSRSKKRRTDYMKEKRERDLIRTGAVEEKTRKGKSYTQPVNSSAKSLKKDKTNKAIRQSDPEMDFSGGEYKRMGSSPEKERSV